MPLAPLRELIAAYEAELADRLGPALVRSDLKHKHALMAGDSAFVFLRATCWRWAEAAADLCPDLMHAPLADPSAMHMPATLACGAMPPDGLSGASMTTTRPPGCLMASTSCGSARASSWPTNSCRPRMSRKA